MGSSKPAPLGPLWEALIWVSFDMGNAALELASLNTPLSYACDT